MAVRRCAGVLKYDSISISFTVAESLLEAEIRTRADAVFRRPMASRYVSLVSVVMLILYDESLDKARALPVSGEHAEHDLAQKLRMTLFGNEFAERGLAETSRISGIALVCHLLAFLF